MPWELLYYLVYEYVNRVTPWKKLSFSASCSFGLCDEIPARHLLAVSLRHHAGGLLQRLRRLRRGADRNGRGEGSRSSAGELPAHGPGLETGEQLEGGLLAVAAETTPRDRAALLEGWPLVTVLLRGVLRRRAPGRYPSIHREPTDLTARHLISRQ